MRKEMEILKEACNTKLEKKVYRIIKRELKDYNGDIKEVLKDFSHGCVNGSMSDFIYYVDTVKAFNYYKKDVIKLIENDIKEGLFNIEYIEDENGYYTVVVLGEEVIKTVEYSNSLLNTHYNDYQKNNMLWYAVDSIVFKLLRLLEL